MLRAATTREARKIINENNIAAALIDYSLAGGESGLDFIEEIGGRESAFPSVILTGMEAGTVDKQAILTGAYDYIDKLAVSRDLVDRSIRFAISAHEYEQKLRASIKDAEAQATINRDILAVVSHEMQSPIASLVGYCDHIAGQCQSDNTRNAATRMKTAAIHLEDFLKNLSEFVRLDSGVAEICETIFKPDLLLEESIQLFLPYATHKDIEMKFDFQSIKDIKLSGDAVRIRQILINIIKNAIKFSDTGTIKISAHYKSQILTVLVEDEGVGMPDTQVAAILSGGVTKQQPGKALSSGLGVGLSICFRLLALMNGRLLLRSNIGVGTIAGFEIPLKTAEEEAAA